MGSTLPVFGASSAAPEHHSLTTPGHSRSHVEDGQLLVVSPHVIVPATQANMDTFSLQDTGPTWQWTTCWQAH